MGVGSPDAQAEVARDAPESRRVGEESVTASLANVTWLRHSEASLTTYAPVSRCMVNIMLYEQRAQLPFTSSGCVA